MIESNSLPSPFSTLEMHERVHSFIELTFEQWLCEWMGENTRKTPFYMLFLLLKTWKIHFCNISHCRVTVAHLEKKCKKVAHRRDRTPDRPASWATLLAFAPRGTHEAHDSTRSCTPILAPSPPSLAQWRARMMTKSTHAKAVAANFRGR